MRGSMSGLAGSSRTGSSLGQLMGSAAGASGQQYRLARRSFGGSNHAVAGGNSDENYSSQLSHESYSGGKKANASQGHQSNGSAVSFKAPTNLATARLLPGSKPVETKPEC